LELAKQLSLVFELEVLVALETMLSMVLAMGLWKSLRFVCIHVLRNPFLPTPERFLLKIHLLSDLEIVGHDCFLFAKYSTSLEDGKSLRSPSENLGFAD
jgi:hypothetical protein